MIYAWMLFEWNAERLDLLKYTVWTLKNAKWKSVLGREALVQKLSQIFGQCPNNFWTPTFPPFIHAALSMGTLFFWAISHHLQPDGQLNFCHLYSPILEKCARMWKLLSLSFIEVLFLCITMIYLIHTLYQLQMSSFLKISIPVILGNENLFI